MGELVREEKRRDEMGREGKGREGKGREGRARGVISTLTLTDRNIA